MKCAFSGEHLFEAVLFGGAAKRQGNAGRSEVQIYETGMMTGLRHAPCEIDGGQSLAFTRAWTGNQYDASFGVLIAKAAIQDFVPFYCEAGGLCHKN